MKVRVCPNCGKHNSENDFNCVDCGTTLSTNTIVEIDESEISQNAEPNTSVAEKNTANSTQTTQSSEEVKTIIVCEKCGQKLRIPLRDKKIQVTCPKCRHEFDYPYDLNSTSERSKIMQKWEYLTLIRLFNFNVGLLSSSVAGKWDDGDPKGWDERIKEMGEQGWELVAMCPEAFREGDSWAGTTSQIRLTFKRPK